MSIVIQENFNAIINRTIFDGNIKYNIKYKPFVSIKFLFANKKILTFNIKKPYKKGLFNFNSENEASLYLNGIERPEKLCGDIFTYVVLYPKGWKILKKYGLFIVDTKDVDLTVLSADIYFWFKNTERYGNDYYFRDLYFFEHIDKHYKDLIKNRHLDIDDKAISKITVTTMSYGTLNEIKKASNEVQLLHNELQTFYKEQDKMLEIIRNLNKI